MLDPEAVDLEELRHALDDHTAGTTWWIERSTGQIRPHVADVDPEPEPDPGESGPGESGPGESGWVRIRPTESYESYRDMAEFVAAVHHRRASDLLDRAISGRGAFRRFKDTLFEFPELRGQWFRFRDARSRRRALLWLATAGLVTGPAAEQAAQRHPDPAHEDEDVPAALAVDLAMLYGDRLQQVLLFGSWVHDDGPGEFDLELIVVLTDLRSRWEELRRMDEVLWRHTQRSGMAVTALPVSPAELESPTTPLLVRAAAEAVLVA